MIKSVVTSEIWIAYHFEFHLGVYAGVRVHHQISEITNRSYSEHIVELVIEKEEWTSNWAEMNSALRQTADELFLKTWNAQVQCYGAVYSTVMDADQYLFSLLMEALIAFTG